MNNGLLWVRRSVSVFFIVVALLPVGAGGARACMSGYEGNRSGEAYYAELRKRCGDSSCCLASVRVMQENGYREAVDGKCFEGVRVDMMKCKETLRWCEQSVHNVIDCM